LEGELTTPQPEHNPFAAPGYDVPAAGSMPGVAARPHWFSGPVRILLLVSALAAAALGVAGAFGLDRLERMSAPGVGDCVYLSKAGIGQQAYHRVACSDRTATYKVEGARTGDAKCGSGDYVRFKVTGTGTAKTLCLALNVSTGDCLRNVDDDAGIMKVSCGEPGAEERVQVIPGLFAGECGAGTDKSLFYGGPPVRTVCMAAPGENI